MRGHTGADLRNAYLQCESWDDQHTGERDADGDRTPRHCARHLQCNDHGDEWFNYIKRKSTDQRAGRNPDIHG